MTVQFGGWGYDHFTYAFVLESFSIIQSNYSVFLWHIFKNDSDAYQQSATLATTSHKIHLYIKNIHKITFKITYCCTPLYFSELNHICCFFDLVLLQ